MKINNPRICYCLGKIELDRINDGSALRVITEAGKVDSNKRYITVTSEIRLKLSVTQLVSRDVKLSRGSNKFNT